MTTEAVKEYAINPAETPPDEIMEMLCDVIGQMGSAMVARVAQETTEDGGNADKAYAVVMNDIDRLTHRFDRAVNDELDGDEQFGIVLLAHLQAAVWMMQRYVKFIRKMRAEGEEYEEDDDACTCGECRVAAVDAEMDEEVACAEALVDGNAAVLSDPGTITLPKHMRGVLVRRKTRGDH